MNDTLDQQDNILEDSTYATPYNVDLFLPKPKNFFTEYTTRVLSLPESLKNILMDSSTAEFIEENLGPAFDLTPDQKTEITRIIRDIILGDVSLNSMPSLVSSKLVVDQNTSTQITNKVVNDLFGPAIEDIKKLQAERFQGRTNKPNISQEYQSPKTPERPDLKIDPSINKNNIVDLRNR